MKEDLGLKLNVHVHKANLTGSTSLCSQLYFFLPFYKKVAVVFSNVFPEDTRIPKISFDLSILIVFIWYLYSDSGHLFSVF